MIIDGILKALSRTNPRESAILQRTMQSAVIVKPQNVVEYYFNGTDQEYWSKQDFPNCAPPWPNFWLEWRMPNTCITNDLTAINEARKREGAMKDIRVEEIGKKKYRITWPTKLVENFGVMVSGAPVPEELNLPARWLLTLRYFVENDNCPYLGLGRLWVDKEGAMVKSRELTKALLAISSQEAEFLGRKDGEPDNGPDNSMTEWGVIAIAPKIPKEFTIRLANYVETKMRNPTMLAISFLHCKNVILQGEVLPRKIQKKRAKANKPPISKFYVMEIQPMRKILSERAPGEPAQRALHICRGHFKDYREGRGLFGKVHGLFWWEMHLQGSQEQGVVDKAYKIPGAQKHETMGEA